MNQEDRGYTQELEQLLEQYEDKNPDSFARIIELSMQRIQQLAHYKLLNDRFVHADIQTDDLFQSASLRLYKAMKDVRPRTKNEFLLLVGTMIRREILDTARRLRKRCRICRTTLESDGQIDLSHLADDQNSYTPEEWICLHEAIDTLNEDERRLFELLFYEGNTQLKAAEILGKSEQYVYRCWRKAKVKLGEILFPDRVNSDTVESAE